jgi:hypothetical protein
LWLQDLVSERQKKTERIMMMGVIFSCTIW